MPTHQHPPLTQPRSAMLRRQVVTAAGHLAWVARDVFRHFKSRALTTVVLQVLGTAAGAATVAGVVLYARFLESGKPIHFAGITINLSREAGGVVAFSAALAALGVVSAVCLYLSQWLVLKTSILYLRLNTSRLLRIATDPAYAGWAALVTGRAQTELRRLCANNTLITALVMRRMLSGVVPIIVFLFAATALVVVSPGLTALLVPVTLAYMVPLYRITRGAAAIQVKYMQCNRAARMILRNALVRITGMSTTPDRKRRDAEESIDSPERLAMEDTYCRRRLAEDRVHLLNTVFFVLCAFVLFAYFAIAVGRGEQRWSELLLYIVALRFAVAELRRVTGLMVILSRCMPEFAQFRNFVDAAEGMRRTRERASAESMTLPDSLTIACEAAPLWDAQSSLVVHRGGIVWVLLPWRPTHVDLEMIAVRLQSAATATQAGMVAKTLCYAGSDDDNESLASRMTTEARREWTQLGVAEELQEIIDHADDDDRRDAMQELGREATLTLAADELLQPHEMIVIGAHVLRAMDESFVESLMDMHRGGFVVLAAQDPRVVLDPEFERLQDRVAGVTVLRESHFVACGDTDWLRANLNPLRAALRPRPIDDRVPSALQDDEDEEEEF